MSGRINKLEMMDGTELPIIFITEGMDILSLNPAEIHVNKIVEMMLR